MKYIIKLIALIMLLLFSFSCSHRERSFSILSQEIPTRINPYDSHINYKLYILKQLFEPLFIYGSSGNYTSNILSSWNASEEHRIYTLCLKDGITFSNGKTLTVGDLKKNLLRLEQNKLIKKTIIALSTLDSCMVVRFNDQYIRFPADLSSYTAAIIDPDTEDNNIVIGISDYVVKSITPDIIHLSTQNKDLTYSDIYFYKLAPHYEEGKAPYRIENIDDFNQLPVEYLPDFIRQFNKYEAPILLTLIAIINVKDRDVRNIIFNCLNYDELRHVFTPKRNSFKNIGGILPVGVLGAIETPPDQKCSFQPLKQRVNLTYIEALRPESIGPLQKYVDSRLLRYNIKLNIVKKDINELADMLFSEDKPYDFTIIGMDASSPDPFSFLQYFFDKDILVTKVTSDDLAPLMNEYLATDNAENKKELARKANQVLTDNFQVIPLYQDERLFYFPSGVRNITSDPMYLNFLKISEL